MSKGLEVLKDAAESILSEKQIQLPKLMAVLIAGVGVPVLWPGIMAAIGCGILYCFKKYHDYDAVMKQLKMLLDKYSETQMRRCIKGLKGELDVVLESYLILAKGDVQEGSRQMVYAEAKNSIGSDKIEKIIDYIGQEATKFSNKEQGRKVLIFTESLCTIEMYRLIILRLKHYLCMRLGDSTAASTVMAAINHIKEKDKEELRFLWEPESPKEASIASFFLATIENWSIIVLYSKSLGLGYSYQPADGVQQVSTEACPNKRIFLSKKYCADCYDNMEVDFTYRFRGWLYVGSCHHDADENCNWPLHRLDNKLLILHTRDGKTLLGNAENPFEFLYMSTRFFGLWFTKKVLGQNSFWKIELKKVQVKD